MYSRQERQAIEDMNVSDAVSTEVEQLKKKTRTQLDLLKQQTERLQLFDAQEDIDFAIQWHEITSSQFSKLAFAYGQKRWIERQVLHAEVLAGALVVGLVVHALAFFALVGAYYQLSELLVEHYQIEEGNKDAIRQSMAGLRQALHQAIVSFNEMERKLDSAFSAMEAQNETLSMSIAQLNDEAARLHAQVVGLEGMVSQLQQQQQKILATTEKLNESGEAVSKELDALAVLILEKKTALDLMSETMTTVAQRLLTIERKASDNEQVVNALSAEVNKQVQIAESQANRCASLVKGLDADLERARVASKEKVNKADETIQSSQALRARALRALARKSSPVLKDEDPPEQVRLSPCA